MGGYKLRTLDPTIVCQRPLRFRIPNTYPFSNCTFSPDWHYQNRPVSLIYLCFLTCSIDKIIYPRKIDHHLLFIGYWTETKGNYSAMQSSFFSRVSVQGVKSLGSQFACLCRGFEFYEVKKKFDIIFQKENGNTFTLLIIFIVKCLQKEQNSTNLLLWPPICRNKPAITPKWFNSLDTNSSVAGNCAIL